MDYSNTFFVPFGSSPLVDAVRWLESALLGTVATTIAIIAIASLGFILLTGGVDWQWGVATIVGCFILFGAPRIAEGLQSGTAACADEDSQPDISYASLPSVKAVPIQPQPTAIEHEPVL